MTTSEKKLIKELDSLVKDMDKELRYQAERISQIDQANTELYALTEYYKELIENYELSNMRSGDANHSGGCVKKDRKAV
jgi:hypothetical protein